MNRKEKSRKKFLESKTELINEYKATKYYKDYIAEFEHDYEEELYRKEDKVNNVFVVKKELLEDDVDFKKKNKTNEKEKYGIKQKNKIDKEKNRAVETAVCSVLIFIYAVIFYMSADLGNIYKIIIAVVGLLACVSCILAINNIIGENIKLKSLAVYFDNDVYLSKNLTTFLLGIDNDFKDLAKKANSLKQECKKEYYIEYRLRKLNEDKMGEIGIAVFLLILNIVGWIILLYLDLNNNIDILIWIVILICAVICEFMVNNYIENVKKIITLKKKQKDKVKILKNNDIKIEQRKMVEQKIMYDYEQKRIKDILKGSIITKEDYAKNELKRLKRNHSEYKVEVAVTLGILLSVLGIMIYLDMGWLGNTISGVGAGLCVIIGSVLAYVNREYKLKLQILGNIIKR